MQPMLSALPQQAPARARRGSRGRGNRRGRGGMAMGAAGSGKITVTDSEIVALADDKLVTMELNPGCAQLPRLAQYETMYERYRITRVTVAYEPLSGAATEGNIAVAILPGPKNSKVVDWASIAKCQPNMMRPAWKPGQIRAGPALDAQRFMHAGVTSEDGVAFTIYAKPSKANIGLLRVTYSVEFAFPRPF